MHFVKRTALIVSGITLLSLGGLAATDSAAQSTQPPAPATLFSGSFTYQGELSSNGTPVTGMCDFQFSLYSSATQATQIGTTQAINNTSVQEGRFTAELDATISGPFGGDAFVGPERWIQIAVRCPAGAGTYTTLTPRQKITAAPYALSLKPGATIRGVETGNVILTASNIGDYGSGVAGFGRTSGVYGQGTDSAGQTQGIYGYTTSTSSLGRGVYGRNDGAGVGVYGSSAGPDGVRGESSHEYGNGVVGVATNGPAAYGVWGISTSGRGVVGISTNGRGVVGTSTDGYGISGTSTNSIGIHGTGAMGGVQGFSGAETGVYGNSTSGSGIVGYGSGNYPSIWGLSNLPNPAVMGMQWQGGSGSGVEGVAVSGNGVVGASETGYAGAFYGNVTMTGALYAAVKNFRIDHPLDPANRYLQHAAVESSDMKTIYDGMVTLDADGAATVTLPDWFEALNGEFRYQLTAIGAPGPGLYIAQEIQNNSFSIAGGAPGMSVSWQVTGIRHDPYAAQHPLEVEVAKPPTERGTFLAPEAHGQPQSLGLNQQYRQQATSMLDPQKILKLAPSPSELETMLNPAQK